MTKKRQVKDGKITQIKPSEVTKKGTQGYKNESRMNKKIECLVEK